MRGFRCDDSSSHPKVWIIADPGRCNPVAEHLTDHRAQPARGLIVTERLDTTQGCQNIGRVDFAYRLGLQILERKPDQPALFVKRRLRFSFPAVLSEKLLGEGFETVDRSIGLGDLVLLLLLGWTISSASSFLASSLWARASASETIRPCTKRELLLLAPVSVDHIRHCQSLLPLRD